MQDICEKVLNINKTENKKVVTRFYFNDLIKKISSYKVKFVPSKFVSFAETTIGKIQFGENLYWLNKSLILNIYECVSSIEMTNSKECEGSLLYRATRDGFGAKAFHSKCGRRENTITLI